MSLNMFGSPASYIQGSDVLFKSTEYLARLGNRILLLAGPTSLRIVGNEFGDYLINNDFTVTKVQFNGESSENEIKRVSKIGHDNHVEMVIGLGGGKTIDAAKAIADNLSVKTVILPTVASTDAPCSRLSVIYSIIRTPTWSWLIPKSSPRHQPSFWHAAWLTPWQPTLKPRPSKNRMGSTC